MKRLLTFICMSLLVLINIQALESTTYHPFVERAKRWCVHGFSMGGDHTVTDYYFSPEKNQLERNGHSYEQLCARTQDGEDKHIGWFREENQRVYMYNEEEDKEVLTYDFSLKVGDRFEPEYGDFEHCEVTKIDYLMVYGDSLKVINFRGKDKTSSLSVLVKGRWIEGIGSEMNPLDGLFSHSAPNSWSYQLAYVAGNTYLPFSFGIPYNGWWGQDLARGEEDQDYARTHSFNENDLHYELVPDPEHDAYALHVSGIMWLYCGGNLYAYCRTERTEDITAYKLYLQLDTPTDYTDCTSPYHVELYFPFFLAEHKYIVVDEQGEHPVAVKDVSYRPLIEEGKVWRTGVTFPNISFSHLYDYYIQGDTIIDNHACKKLMRSELQYPQNYPEHIDTTYAASLYEEGQRVYVVLPGESHLELAYDFASPVGSHIDIDGFNIIVTRKEEKATGCFKGRCTYVGLEEEYEDISFESCWIEGVGLALNPLYSLNELLPTGLLKELLIFCFVNDEVLYYNSDIFDGDIYGLTPQAGEVKRQWLDFTHIKKPRPRAPGKERRGMIDDEGGDAETLTGEYSIKDLFVNFKPLLGAYTITVTDANDEEVYHKEVQTDNVIALNTALSTYAPGTYTLTVENAEEAYTATFILDDETAVRDIPSDSTVNHKSVNSKYYDLSGRQIPQSSFLKGQASKLERLTRHLPKGIYIRDGKKVVVR